MNSYNIRITKVLGKSELEKFSEISKSKLFFVFEKGSKTSVEHIQGVMKSDYKLTKLRDLIKEFFNVDGKKYSITTKDPNPAYLLKDWNENNDNIIINQIYSSEEIIFWKSKNLQYQEDMKNKRNEKKLLSKSQIEILLEYIGDVSKYTNEVSKEAERRDLLKYISIKVIRYYTENDKLIPSNYLLENYIRTLYFKLSSHSKKLEEDLSSRLYCKVIESIEKPIY